jgi:hypothetical protein
MKPGSSSGESAVVGMSRTAVPRVVTSPGAGTQRHGALWCEASRQAEAT